jgi:hypothetical protein
MFPFAIAIAGWFHMWDLVVKNPLSNAHFFPARLEKLKALISFLWSKTYLPALVRSLREAGKDGLADVLESLSLPTFAAWRWRTLEHACVELDKCLESLAAHFDPTPFSNVRNGAEFQKVLQAFGSLIFHRIFRFVLWFCVWIGGIMKYVKRCDCHSDAESAEGCHGKGRRLKTAYAFATARLQAGRDEASRLPLDFF